MKHLKLRAALPPKGELRMTITIMEQTHFRDRFAPKHPDFPNGAFVHGNVLLLSDGMLPLYAEAYVRAGGNKMTWVILKGAKEHASELSNVPVAKWKEIKEAVKAYNEWGATRP